MKLIFIILTLQVGHLCVAQTRIITAGSAITEIVCALGDGDKIIASDRTSLYPEYIQKLPSIGYRSGISAEGIINLNPSLIIAERDYVGETVIRQLMSGGFKVIVVEPRYSFNDTKKSIAQIASALNRVKEGQSLIAKNESELTQAKTWLSGSKTTPKVLCVYNRGTATMSVAGKKTFCDVLEYAGAVNALAEVEGYKPLNTESLIASNPDFLLMGSSGLESIGGIEGVLKISGVGETSAGKKKQVVAIETLKLTNFGPRLGEAVKELVVSLHPELRPR